MTPLKVSIHPALSLTPGVASPGQDVLVSGGGFSANASVTLSATFPLYGGGSRTVTVTAHTNGSGAFSARLPVPANAAAAMVTVTAQGPNGWASAQLRSQAVQARIVASPATAAPGSTITVSRSGYLGGTQIDVSVTVKLTNGSTQTLSARATTKGSGQTVPQMWQ